MSPFPKPSPVSQEIRWAALGGGLGYVLVLLASAVWAYGLTDVSEGLVSIQIGPWLWWALLGGSIVGAVLAAAFVHYGLVFPLLSVTLVYGVAMYQMWQVLQSPPPLLPGTPLDLYLVGWPLLLAIALGIGLIERRVRAAKPSSETSEVT